ncbi:MAG: hypothetical protein ACOC0X_00570 [Halobacteriota archaeon]
MSAIPAGIDTGRGPPMRLPLQHFFVGLGFLLLGGLVGVANAIDVGRGLVLTAQLHLLLVGWVCITIMGAMTQFVPVWGGVDLYSRRLARWALGLVVLGLLGLAGGLMTMRFDVVAGFAPVLLLGIWAFVYNIGRTLVRLDAPDRTARHFGVALAAFVLLTILGVALAVDLHRPTLHTVGITHGNARLAHLTLAVFGAVLLTVVGALYQLATMFTQTELHGVDHHLAAVEEALLPVGAFGLAIGRLLAVELLAAAGGLAVVIGVLAIAVVLGRKLGEMRVPWTPMHRRYVVVTGGLAVWAVSTAPSWAIDPLSPATRFGGPVGAHLIGGVVFGFVIMGTLYHVIPFIVWVERYSDRLGFERVPMVDDLYLERVANADFVLLVAGNALLLVWELFGLPLAVGLLAMAMIGGGILLFVGNMFYVVHRHGPDGLHVLLPSRS